MNRMMQRAAMGAAALALMLGTAVPVSAQVVHSIGLGAGVFSPRSLDARDIDDVLVENLNTLSFGIKDFRGGLVFGEWAMTFSDRVELALSAGYYRRTVPSVYADYINNNAKEIEQDLRLQVVPMSAIVRFLPVGRAGRAQPYLGGGVSALRWRYSEIGEFVDFNNNFAVFRDRYIANGTTLAPVVLGGLRLPLGGDIYSLNTELRYQFGSGDLGANSGFLTEKIDLSGLNFTVGFQIRF